MIAPPPSSRFDSFRRIVEISANLALIFTAVVALTVFLRHRTDTSTSSSRIAHAAPASPVGTKIDLPGVDWSQHKATLVIAISSTCHYCVSSATFYSQLTKVSHPLPVVVVIPQRKQTASAFLTQHQITPQNLVSTDLVDIHVDATPTLLLVSSSGVITKTWVGELTDSQQGQVLTAINSM